ncbi:MAG: hypothetical protein R3B68_14070 [Phycisphaerales bacterium]
MPASQPTRFDRRLRTIVARSLLHLAIGGSVTVLTVLAIVVLLPYPQQYQLSHRRSFPAHWLLAGDNIDQAFTDRRFGRTSWQLHGPETIPPHYWDEWVTGALQIGWPLRCFETVGVYDARSKKLLSSTFDMGVDAPRWTSWLRRYGVAYSRVPLRPLWGGVLGNCLFWGVVSFGVGAAFTSWRSSRRVRRGRCRECGYDLAGLPTCPECGRDAPPRPAKPPPPLAVPVGP